MTLSVVTSPNNQSLPMYNPAPAVPLRVVTSPSPAPLRVVTGGTQPARSPYGSTVNPVPQTVNPVSTANPMNPGSGVAANPYPAGSGVPPATGQTFQFGDGSIYDSNGTPVSPANPAYSGSGGYGNSMGNGYMYGGVSNLSPGPDLNTPTPSTTTDSSALTNNTGYSDIMSMLHDNLSNMDKFFANLSNYAQVGPEEKAQQAKVASDQAGMTALGYQAKGLYNPDGQTIALPFLTGQAQSKMVGAGIQSTLDQSVLNYMQGNRQFAFNSASTIFDASRNNLSSMLDAYTKMAPQNIGTNYNESTGQLTAIMRNPLTGATYTGDLGNIGAKHAFTSTNIAQDPLTGQLTFIGTTADGRIIQQPVGGMSGNGIGTGSGGTTGVGTVSVPGYGGALNPSTGQPWRTDANNNPIAAAVTPGGSNQFTQALDKAGIGWTYGSTFSNGSMATIKILGDPVEGARAILANSNALQGWYANHTGAAVMKQYGIYNNTQFAKATPQVQNAIIDGIYKAEVGSGVLTHPQSGTGAASLPPALQGAVKTLSDGTKYFDTNNLTAAQIPMAQAYAAQTGIHYVAPQDASKLGDINVTGQNLNEFKQFADNVLGNVPGVFNSIYYNAAGALGGTTKTQFDSYRNVAINAIQSLAGGTGSGLRITSGEIAQAVSNLPTIGDSRSQADTKLNVLNGLLNKWTAQILPGWRPSGTMSGGTNSTSILNGYLGY